MSRNSKPTFLRRFATGFISLLAGLFFLWLLLYGKNKIGAVISPITNLPKDQAALTKLTDQILGIATDKLKSGDTAKKAVETGTQVFEQSTFTQPARGVRDDIKSQLDSSIDSLKKLPAREVEVIKRQFCQEWFGQVTPPP